MIPITEQQARNGVLKMMDMGKTGGGYGDGIGDFTFFLVSLDVLFTDLDEFGKFWKRDLCIKQLFFKFYKCHAVPLSRHTI